MSPLFRRRGRGPADDIPAEDQSRVPFLRARESVEDPAADAESSELAERLRHLDWPAPPQAVRERCLDEIMKRVGSDEKDAAERPVQG